MKLEDFRIGMIVYDSLIPHKAYKVEGIALGTESNGNKDQVILRDDFGYRKSHFHPDLLSEKPIQVYVDLDLPSKTLWLNGPVMDCVGGIQYVSYEKAIEEYHKCGLTLPKSWQFLELVEECTWVWQEANGGYEITGKKGNHIFIPAAGYSGSKGVERFGEVGYYWSATPVSSSEEGDPHDHYHLLFTNNLITRGISGLDSNMFPIITCKR